jgi:hypothetical protein
MIATALILAGGLAATPVPATTASNMPNFYHQPARCGPIHDQVVQHQKAALRGRAGGFRYAVMRKVDGCGVAAPVGYRPDYLLPGQADAPQYRPIADKDPPKR